MSSNYNSETSCLIIGAGAGGMTTAITLARAGQQVTVVEEGSDKSNAIPFSLEEVRQDYRSGGQTLTIGTPFINLGEGCVLGGGTAVNTGYYIRANSGKLEKLVANWKIDELSEAQLQEDFEAIESELCPQTQDGVDWISEHDWLSASQACHFKADRAQFIHKWNSSTKKLERRSVFDVWKSELESLNVKIISDCRIKKLTQNGQKWVASGTLKNTKEVDFKSKSVFLCAGPIESAALLRRSGITKNVGNNLQFHLFLRVLAKFNQKINPDRCPLYPWKSSNDLVTVGHSPDYPHLMALAFPEMLEELKLNWEKWSSFYVSIPTEYGRLVRAPFQMKQPLLFSSLSSGEKQQLSQAFHLLQNFLSRLGVTETYPKSLSLKSLQSVHLYGTCPMGEDLDKCATNSWGKVFGHDSLYVNDASLIGSSIGQNPQATIMAIARRNSRHFLSAVN